MLAYVTEEYLNNWVVISAKGAIVVAFDTDRQTAIDKAKAVGIAEEQASVVFIHQGGMSNLYIPGPPEEDSDEILGDERKGKWMTVRNTFLESRG